MNAKALKDEIEYQERLLDGLYFSVQQAETHLAYLKELRDRK